MGIQRSDVEKVAKLSRIALRDDQVDLFADQLSRILNYVDQLNQLDTEAVEPLSHALPVANVFRDDVPHESLPADQALANTAARTETSFKVPRVLDDGGSA
jgi:aspartyl-tRNA(Asn)/glutamyl-tRNA(Gln) amidotransferase subunit C